jgi:hypothetical protein
MRYGHLFIIDSNDGVKKTKVLEPIITLDTLETIAYYGK